MKKISRFVLSRWRRLVVFLAFAALLFFGLQLNEVVTRVNQAVFESQWAEKQRAAEYLCELIDIFVEQDLDWNEYDYSATLVKIIEIMDLTRGTTARLFDDELTLLSTRLASDGETPLTFINNEEVIRTVTSNQRGVADVLVRHESRTVPIRIFYSWIPTGETYDNRILLIDGMTPDAVIENPSSMLTRWCWMLLLTAGVALLASSTALLIPENRRVEHE